MHEMSLVQNLLDIVRQEMRAHELTQLQEVKIACGRLSGALPQALHMAFAALTRNTDLDGACLNLELIPLQLCCGSCAILFAPEQEDFPALFTPCPACGQEVGHRVVTGQELHIEYIEGE